MAKRSVVDHIEYFTKGRIVTSPAVSITDSRVLTKHGEHVRYDYLVITTGHGYPSPRTRSEKISYYQEGQLLLFSSLTNITLYEIPSLLCSYFCVSLRQSMKRLRAAIQY